MSRPKTRRSPVIAGTHLIIIALFFVTGCTTGVHRSPSKSASVTVSFERPVGDASGFLIRRSDGRSWWIPTVFYEPDKIGVDHLAMKDYVVLRHCVSPNNDIIALQEAGEGENHSTRVLYIRGDSVRLYSIYGMTRKLRPGDPIVGLTDELQSVSGTGITLSGVFFGWKELRLLFQREIKAKVAIR